MLVPNELPTNAILGATDVLITDYSSIFFDFLETGRPVAFFAPDLADYSDTRGLYLEPDQWPGPVAMTAHELGDILNAIAADGDAIPATRRERYLQMQQEFCGFDDGQASDRVVDIVFRGNDRRLPAAHRPLGRPQVDPALPRRHAPQRHHDLAS